MSRPALYKRGRERLMNDVRTAINMPRQFKPSRTCQLCGWPCHPTFRGRNQAHADPTFGTLCGVCHDAPMDGPEALRALNDMRGGQPPTDTEVRS